MAWTEEQRDEVARILTLVAEEGLDHPRNLDSALDAISETLIPVENIAITDTLKKIRARCDTRIEAIGRKRSWRPSEKAFATAAVQFEANSLDKAISALER